jgi:hypothetical protein
MKSSAANHSELAAVSDTRIATCGLRLAELRSNEKGMTSNEQ